MVLVHSCCQVMLKKILLLLLLFGLEELEDYTKDTRTNRTQKREKKIKGLQRDGNPAKRKSHNLQLSNNCLERFLKLCK